MRTSIVDRTRPRNLYPGNRTQVDRIPKSSCDSSHRLWPSKSWNQLVNSCAQLFRQLQHLNLLFNHSKVLCVSAGAVHEVMAFNKVGVADVELMDSSLLVSWADPHNFPFFDEVFDVTFTAHLEEELFPSRFVGEIERTVRNAGVCVVLVEECGCPEVKEIVTLLRKSRFVDAINVTVNGSKTTRILMRR